MVFTDSSSDMDQDAHEDNVDPAPSETVRINRIEQEEKRNTVLDAVTNLTIETKTKAKRA